ncbi:hypothetical protein HDU91_002485, partial [Kappamyces sp. JEL0680]
MSISADSYQPAPRNPDGTFSGYPNWPSTVKSFAEIWKWRRTANDQSNVPVDKTVLDKTLPVEKPDFSPPPEGKFKLHWLGHASVLLQVGDFNLLTDPVYSERCSPLSFAGPKRYRPAPISSVEELPPLDAVCISHNHYDHMDVSTIDKLAQQFPAATWYLPLNNASYLPASVPKAKIVELDWWEEAKQKNFVFTL